VIAFDLLGIEEIYSSSIPLSKGFVKSGHGYLPLPAPAALELLKGRPVYNTDIEGELVTPTGAAIISTLSSGFGIMPEMKINSIGYGAGKSNLDKPNLLRVVIGEATAISKEETVCLIETNIDDMNPQIYDHLFEKLFEGGALDVYLTNIQMKKNRPAIKLSVLSNRTTLNRIIKIISDETTTLGIRIQEIKRITADRRIEHVATKFGKIKIKVGKFSDSALNISPEFEDLKKAANKHNVPLKAVYREVLKNA
jgi:hypothetical protein